MYYTLWYTVVFILYNKLIVMCFASLTVPSTCKIYEYIESYMSKKYTGRHLEIDNESRINIARNTITWVRYENKILGVLYYIDDRSSICNKKTYIIWAFRRSTLEDFIVYVTKEYKTSAITVEVRTSSTYDWNIQSHPVRSVSSIVNSAPIVDMISDASKFIADKKRYIELGVPYRRGYLLDGPPGTGKSTSAICLAGQLNRPLCYMSLTGKHANDEWLMEMLSRAPEGAIVLFDDYDRFSASDSQGDGITIGGLLNALDGVVAQTGKIMLLAVNDSSTINDAILRAGRIDRHFTFRLSTKDEACDLFEKFYGSEYIDMFKNNLTEDFYSPASIVSHLIKYDSAKEAASKPLKSKN